MNFTILNYSAFSTLYDFILCYLIVLLCIIFLFYKKCCFQQENWIFFVANDFMFSIITYILSPWFARKRILSIKIGLSWHFTVVSRAKRFIVIVLCYILLLWAVGNFRSILIFILCLQQCTSFWTYIFCVVDRIRKYISCRPQASWYFILSTLSFI